MSSYEQTLKLFAESSIAERDEAMSKEAISIVDTMTLALEALELMYACYAHPDWISHKQQEEKILAQCVATTMTLRQALAKQEQGEPVEWGVDWGKDGNSVSIIKRLANGGIEVVGWEYAPHPQPAQKPLTDEQMKENFETWHKETYVQSLEIYGDTYKNMHVRNRWQGWLAAHGIKENT